MQSVIKPDCKVCNSVTYDFTLAKNSVVCDGSFVSENPSVLEYVRPFPPGVAGAAVALRRFDAPIEESGGGCVDAYAAANCAGMAVDEKTSTSAFSEAMLSLIA